MVKIFGTDGIRCVVNKEPMTAETSLKIAKATGYILSNIKNKRRRVIISKDTRLSGYLFEPIITGGFISMGMDVILVGPLPTPALPMLIKSLRADMGVMITASHNTYEYNGLKFFDKNGFKLNKALEKKIEKIVSDSVNYKKIMNKGFITGKAIRLEDAKGRYSEFLKSTLDKKIKLKKFKIILDCANGATYNVAPSLLWELGFEVITINKTPTGININKNCGAVNTTQLSRKVLKEKADIGFAFDGDGDRIIAVDEKGKEIDGDKLIALLANNLIKLNKLKHNTVVTTVMSNLGFENYLQEKLNIKLIRKDVGDVNVIAEMNKNNYILGGEQSGHVILKEYINTGDGILVCLKILEIMSTHGKKASKLFDLYSNYEQIKINLPVKVKINTAVNKKILSISNSFKKQYPELRFLIRLSGTEPLLRILIEGKIKKNVLNISNILKTKIENIV